MLHISEFETAEEVVTFVKAHPAILQLEVVGSKFYLTGERENEYQISPNVTNYQILDAIAAAAGIYLINGDR